MLGLAFACAVVASVGSCVWPRLSLFDYLRRAAAKVGASGALKVALVFAQTTATVNSGWPEWVQSGGMRLLSIANGSVAGTGVECLLSWMSDPVVNLAVFQGVVPVASVAISLAVILCALWPRSARSCHRRRSGNDDSNTQPSMTMAQSAPGSQHSLKLISPPPNYTSAGHAIVSLQRADARDSRRESRPWEGGLRVWTWLAYWLVFEITVRSADVFNCPEALRTDTRWMRTLPWLLCDAYAHTPFACRCLQRTHCASVSMSTLR